jgi:hypothetical protein
VLFGAACVPEVLAVDGLPAWVRALQAVSTRMASNIVNSDAVFFMRASFTYLHAN